MGFPGKLVLHKHAVVESGYFSASPCLWDLEDRAAVTICHRRKSILRIFFIKPPILTCFILATYFVYKIQISVKFSCVQAICLLFLTANQTPLVNILGDRYASRESLSTSKVVEELITHIEFHKNCCMFCVVFHASC